MKSRNVAVIWETMSSQFNWTSFDEISNCEGITAEVKNTLEIARNIIKKDIDKN